MSISKISLIMGSSRAKMASAEFFVDEYLFDMP